MAERICNFIRLNMTIKKTLYKIDSLGKTRVLNYWNEGNFMCQSSGILGGTLVENIKAIHGKNIGRSNETTNVEQAILEIESKIREKINEGYFENLEDIKGEVKVLPMLAKDFKKIKPEKIAWNNAYGQVKFDGQRMMAIKKDGKVTLMSRGGKEILTLDHIKYQLENDLIPDGIYDGEAYCKELGSFQEQMKAIKKVGPNTYLIRYHVYDVVLPIPFAERYEHLKGIFSLWLEDYTDIVLVETHKLRDINDLISFHRLNLSSGYEGSMIRISGKPYELDSRSDQLLKYKDFQDVQLTIKDVIPQESRPLLGQFIFHWPGAKGHPMGDNILGCGMKYSHEEREEFLTNKSKYIGKDVELRFFEYSEENIPRFPVAISLL